MSMGKGAAVRGIGVAVAVALVALVAYEAYAVMRAKANTPGAIAKVAGREVRLGDLSRWRLHALLKVEDPGFYRHHGLDFVTPGQGMTTITQSLVKHMYFKHFHQGFGKIDQDLIARFVLDPAMTKTDQLEVFLNYTYLGHVDGRDVIGFPEAARVYYGKDLATISDRQYLSRVAMDIAPDQLDPKGHAAANAERVDRIQRLLAGQCKPRSFADMDYPDCARGGTGTKPRPE